MKRKKDRQFYIDRAIDDFKTLVIYFNVTRPQYEKNYRIGGKFSKDEMIRQCKFLSSWKDKSTEFKKTHAKLYAKYSMTYNYTFGIPTSLIKQVLGRYADSDGRKTSITIDEVVSPLLKSGFIHKKNHGTKTDHGTGKVKFYWHNKYILDNKYWLKLISMKCYSSINTLPDASNRMKKIIHEWLNKNTKVCEPIGTGDIIPAYSKGIISLDDAVLIYENIKNILLNEEDKKRFSDRLQQYTIDATNTTNDMIVDFWRSAMVGIHNEDFKMLANNRIANAK